MSVDADRRGFLSSIGNKKVIHTIRESSSKAFTKWRIWKDSLIIERLFHKPLGEHSGPRVIPGSYTGLHTIPLEVHRRFFRNQTIFHHTEPLSPGKLLTRHRSKHDYHRFQDNPQVVHHILKSCPSPHSLDPSKQFLQIPPVVARPTSRDTQLQLPTRAKLSTFCILYPLAAFPR